MDSQNFIIDKWDNMFPVFDFETQIQDEEKAQDINIGRSFSLIFNTRKIQCNGRKGKRDYAGRSNKAVDRAAFKNYS